MLRYVSQIMLFSGASKYPEVTWLQFWSDLGEGLESFPPFSGKGFSL